MHFRSKFLQVLTFLVLGFVMVGIAAAAMPFVGLLNVKDWLKKDSGEGKRSQETRAPTASLAEEPDTLRLPADVVQKMHIRTAEVVAASRPRPLPPLAGQFALDADHLHRARARFAGEVVDLGQTADEARQAADGTTVVRPLRFGDRVQKGQLLAVVSSKDFGEKKSELVDAISKRKLDEETLRQTRDLDRKGAIPERSVREAERNLAADDIAIDRAVRTLRSWRLTEDEIDAIKAEAEALHRDYGKGTARPAADRARRAQDARWAHVEVRAPFDGTIVEKNVAVGDLVDTSTDLLKVADLSRLAVWAYVYEEDLHTLQSLPRPVHWAVRLKANPDAPVLHGTIDQIGDIIDPNTHTALVIGHVDNPRGEYRVNQFITATIDLPAPPDEVEVPTSALVEDGQDSIVFVQPDPAKPEYKLQRVSVASRFFDVVYVRNRPEPEAPAKGKAAGAKHAPAPLQPGALVVTSGALEMKAALEELQAASKSGK
jgi:cobalt-zinc-cadmium efflux system membrane fusion protein